MSALRNVLFIARVEIAASLRDRQTILNAVVLPLVLYPGLFWVMLQGMTLAGSRAAATSVAVEIVGSDTAAREALLRDADSERIEHSDGGALPYAPDAGLETLTARLRDDVESPIDALVVLPESEGETAQLVFDGTRSRGTIAADRMRRRLSSYAHERRAQELESAGIAPAAMVPFDVELQNLATERDMGGFALSLLLPLLLVVMTVMGAFTPAVDLTAGERERGTLETTLLHPIAPSVQQAGRILTVATLGLLAAMLNLASLGLSARTLLVSLGSGINIEVPLLALLKVAPLAALFAVFCASVLTAVASLAQSFKQAQSSLGAVQLMFFLPAVVAGMPGMNLTPALAATPVVGFVLSFKSMLQTGTTLDGSQSASFAIATLALIVYTALAFWISTALFAREGVRVRSRRLSVLEAVKHLFRRTSDV